jgi:hypothetical protein
MHVPVTDAAGPPDLDFRPAEPARSSMLAGMHRCASCGYCSSLLEQAPEEIAELIASPAYQSLLVEDGLPELARTFLCAAEIAEVYGPPSDAAKYAIEASWVCDDAEDDNAARRCRMRAIELLYECIAEGDEIFPDVCADHAVLVDLLRRVARFDDAISLAETDLSDAEDLVAAVLAFSRSLALRADTARYSVDDVPASGVDDCAIVEALKQLEACREHGDCRASTVLLQVDDARNYYVQFALDEAGVCCEVVHNRYLACENAFTGDDIATLLALGFEVPRHATQNFFRVFEPSGDSDFELIVSLVRTVVGDYFGLSPTHPLQMVTEFGEPARS